MKKNIKWYIDIKFVYRYMLQWVGMETLNLSNIEGGILQKVRAGTLPAIIFAGMETGRN